jgi:hypothetical protein
MSIHDEMMKMEKRRLLTKTDTRMQDFLKFTKSKQEKDVLRTQLDEYEQHLNMKKDKDIKSIMDKLIEELN